MLDSNVINNKYFRILYINRVEYNVLEIIITWLPNNLKKKNIFIV